MSAIVEETALAGLFVGALTQPLPNAARSRELRQLTVQARWNLAQAEACVADSLSRGLYLAQADVLLAQLQEAL